MLLHPSGHGAPVQGTVASSLRPTATLSRPAPTIAVTREEPTPVPATPEPQADWVLYEQPEDGFALQLPSSWNVIDLSEGDLKSILGTVAELNPEMKALVEGQAESLIASGCRFCAFEIDLASLAEGSVP